MSITILRTADAWWVRTPGGAASIDTNATSTGELLVESAKIDAARGSKEAVDVATLDQIHARALIALAEQPLAGIELESRHEMLEALGFRRRDPRGGCAMKRAVYAGALYAALAMGEVEIGLVIGRELAVGTQVTRENWTSFVAGLVVTNDVSARDVQLPKTQFYESKSYPTFTPVGPSLVLLDDDELKRFGDLRLRLWVNGELRQDSVVAGDMIYPPWAALEALSRFQRLDAGDLLLTGTPEGTALSAPPRPVEIIAALLPPALKWKLFFQRQAQNPKYLKDGDVVELAIGTDDGAIDLGRQRTVVRGA